MPACIRNLCLVGILAATAMPQDVWTSRSPLPSAYSMRSLACSPKLCVGVDANNSLLVTQDGKSWSAIPTKVDFLSSVVWTGSVFRAVGYGAIGTSDNGLDWSFKSWDVADRGWQTYSGVQVGNRFLALGSDSMLVTTDGIHWQSDTTACHISDNASFASNGATTLIVRPFAFCRSVDTGRTWSFQTYLPLGQDSGTDVKTVAWDGKKFLVGTEGGVVASADGIQWSVERNSGMPSEYLAGDTNSMVSIGMFGIEMRRADGTWTRVDSSAYWGSIHALQKSPWGYLAIGDVGVLASSPDGLVWTRNPSPGAYREVAFAVDQFVAVGDSGLLSRSRDGVAWTSVALASKISLRSVAGGGGKSVAVGDSGRVLVATDSATWLPMTTGTTLDLHSVIWDGHQFVAGGDSGMILTSMDAQTWTKEPRTIQAALLRLQLAGNRLFALDAEGVIWRKNDSALWVKSSPASVDFKKFAGSIDSVLLAYDANSRLWKSSNGDLWTQLDYGALTVAFPLVSMLRIGGQWLAIEERGYTQSSTDGLNWVGRSVSSALLSLATHDGIIVGVGSNGAIETSPEVVVPTSVRKRAFAPQGLAAWMRSGKLLLVPASSGKIELVLVNLAGREVFRSQGQAVANQELSTTLPFALRTSMMLVVRQAGGERRILIGPSMSGR